MNWLTFILRQGWRRPIRAAVTVAGVAIAIAAFYSLLAFHWGYRRGMESELDRLGAHVLVVPKGCPYDAASIALHGANWPCYLKEGYLGDVRATPGIANAAPVFMAATPADDGLSLVYVGVETNLLALKRDWKIRGAFPQNTDEILAGADAAQRCRWQIGQRVSLPGIAGENRVLSGILDPTGGPDDIFVFMQLPDAQRVFKHPAELTHILVRLVDPTQLEFVVAQLRGCSAGMEMNVIPLVHLFRSIQSLLRSTRLWLGAITLVALLAAAAGVSNTIFIAVAEQTREIGIMRAIGASRADIFLLFWLQTLLVTTAGALVGLLAAFAASPPIEAWARAQLPFAPSGSLLCWEWAAAALSLLGGIVLGSMAGLIPAWHAAQLPPLDAIRFQTERL